MKMGKDPRRATLESRAEIALATITITLVVVVVYLPVAFVSGIIGQVFFEYGITISVATLVSLLISYTLTPMLSALWLKGEAHAEPEPPVGLAKIAQRLFKPVTWLWEKFIVAWETGFTFTANMYAVLLRWVLKNFLTQWLVVVISALALAAGIYLVVSGIIPTEFIPQEDDGQIKVSLKMPAGTSNSRYRVELFTFVFLLKKIKVRQLPLNGPTSEECR
jgi:HAE1 family hydrophobic/amphiphilic exporter-1